MKVKTEFFRAFRYGIVGGISSATYVTLVVLQTKFTELHPVAINTIAYALAFCVSATGHSLFSFRLQDGYKEAVGKFFIVSLSALILSNTVIAVSLNYVPQTVAQILGVIFIPGYSFTLSRLWAFKHGIDKQQ